MRNRLCSALAILLGHGLVVAQIEPSAPSKPASAFVTVAPAGKKPSDWVPAAVLWWPGGGDDANRAAQSLSASGFAVLQVVSAPGAADLGRALTRFRGKFRIDQGAMHAVVASSAKLATASLLEHGHQFQTIAIATDISDAELASLKKLRTRRVRKLPDTGAQPGLGAHGLAEYVLGLHRAGAPDASVAAVFRTLDSFHDAAAVADQDRYFAILPDDAVFLGTDPNERWTGKQFRAFAMRYFERDSAWTYVPLQRHVTLSKAGDVAWFDEVLDNSGYGECRGTGVLTRRNNRWVLLQYNLTVPVPNDLMRDIARQIRQHN